MLRRPVEGTIVLVETKNLTKVFGEVRAVDDLSVAIPEGAIGLVGPNGAGKTTFLRLLLSLLQPTAGTAKVLGRNILDGVPLRERIGYMPEHDCLIPDMTGVGLVAFMGRVSGLDADSAIGRAHDVLQFVGVEEERYRKVAEYSTGMKQKVKLAQSMVHDPQLYIFDEPTTGLDPRGRTEMLDLVRAIASSPGRNVILSSHLLPDVETICKYVVILDGGHQIAAGDLHDLLTGAADRLRIDIRGDREAFVQRLREAGLEAEAGPTGVHVGRRPGVEAEVFQAAKALGAEVRYMGREIRSLEEFFLELVARNEGKGA
ncbi:MAG: ABC transporter ATP-binding protein [Methanobacteriota archaeon]|nr:MAG: ABC transporter ATP-binding protein [Euryarchaeota archaeon]TMA05791.1 MAG: ABC transporter ATP-binding protein [Euryarchaeota archaeon]